MFWFDKDMERVMLAKKKEVLAQIEDAKKRVLKEMYCVKREVHTDFCEMLADYNRIDFALKKLVADLKQEVKDCVDSYKNILAEQIVSFNQQIDTKINVFEQYVIESIATLENALAELETMQNTVNGLITRVEELVDGCASAEDLEQLRQEFETAIANIDLSAFKEEILSEVVQSDWETEDELDRSFVKNRTHYLIHTDVKVLFGYAVSANDDGLNWYDYPEYGGKVYDNKTNAKLVLSDGSGVVHDFGYFSYKTPSLELAEYDEEHGLYAYKIFEGEFNDHIFEAYLVRCSDNKWRYRVGYTGCNLDFPTTLQFVTATIEAKTLEPYFLASNISPHKTLSIDGNAKLVWVDGVNLVSPIGSVYKLIVADDGTLSTTPVTT